MMYANTQNFISYSLRCTFSVWKKQVFVSRAENERDECLRQFILIEIADERSESDFFECIRSIFLFVWERLIKDYGTSHSPAPFSILNLPTNSAIHSTWPLHKCRLKYSILAELSVPETRLYFHALTLFSMDMFFCFFFQLTATPQNLYVAPTCFSIEGCLSSMLPVQYYGTTNF